LRLRGSLRRPPLRIRRHAPLTQTRRRADSQSRRSGATSLDNRARESRCPGRRRSAIARRNSMHPHRHPRLPANRRPSRKGVARSGRAAPRTELARPKQGCGIASSEVADCFRLGRIFFVDFARDVSQFVEELSQGRDEDSCGLLGRYFRCLTIDEFR